MTSEKSSVQLKSIYKPIASLESIYAGGKADITPDGRYLITTFGEDVIVSDLTNNLERVAKLEGDSEPVTTFVILPNGKSLVTVSRSQQLRVWDLESFELVRAFRVHDSPVLAIAADPSSTLVATGSADKTVKVWDLVGAFCTHSLRGHQGLISELKFHPKSSGDNLILVSGSEDATVRIWDLGQRKCVAVMTDHVSVIRGLDFSPAANYLISGSRDRTVNVWDMKTYQLAKTVPTYETLEAVGFLQPGTIFRNNKGETVNTTEQPIFYTAGEKGQLKFWDFRSSELIFSQPAPKKTGEEAHFITDVLYRPDDRQLVTVMSDQNITVFTLTDPTSDDAAADVATLVPTVEVAGYNEEIIDVTYVGLEQRHAVVASNSEKLRLYDLTSRQCTFLDHHQGTVLCLDATSSSHLFAVGSKDNTVSVWWFDARPDTPLNARARCVATCTGHTEAIGSVAFARGDVAAFLITGGQDRTLKKWDLGPLLALQEAALAAEGDSKQTQADRDAATARIAAELAAAPLRLTSLFTVQAHAKDINSIAVAPNDQLFATGSQDRTARIWSVDTGECTLTLTGHRRGVWRVEFSPVDQILATCSGDQTIKLWSLNDGGSCLKTFQGHTSAVVNIRFVTAGLQLISVGSDSLVKLWTIKTDDCVLTSDHHTDKVWALAVRHDEAQMITGGGDSELKIWEDCTQREMERLHTEQVQQLAQEQTLQNLVLAKQYRKAITLALQLDKPRQLFRILSEIRSNANPDAEAPANSGDTPCRLGDPAVDRIIATLSLEQLDRLLLYIRDWNTNSRQAEIANLTLQVILDSYSPELLLKIKHMNTTQNALIPFAERHYQRLDGLLTQSYMIDYTLHAMSYLTPFDEETQE
ncbi:U3 small nucleolar RNA-associated protein [Tieghemiomyces parasiticus]|uniref:U3 small nucleolar RNA-associated protein n=1 Tax=Tieghemiomyces parasiticus TaxID=78921 RepID=A0A9W8DN32_9FUNG|nr:U3 small nucleolar RNA-associated protein [Tieghemiomyces parasiticus]